MIKTPILLAVAIAACSLSAQAQVDPNQHPFDCQASAGTPALVRAEGLAERVSDIVLTCSGVAFTGVPPTTNFTVVLGNAPVDYSQRSGGQDASITSRVVAPIASGTEALLLIDDLSTPAVLGTNLFQGVQGGPFVQFLNVPIVPPAAGATRTFRITNLRVDARDLSGPTIQASISVSGTDFFPIQNPVVVVAVKAPGASFSLATTSNAPAFGLTFQQAGGVNPALAMSPATTGSSVNYNLKFTEGFAQSFRKRNAGTTTANPAGLLDQSTPGTDYHTESGFYSGAYPSSNGLNIAGLATQGSRLVAQFKNVPAGVALFVTVNPLPNTGATAATLIATDASGAGPYAPVAATTTANAGGTAVGIAPVSLLGGSGSAVWEILDSDPSALESYTFGLVVAYSAPLTGTTVVSGGLGPLSTVTTGDATSPVPRFADISADTAGCASSPCLTVAPQAIALSYQTGAAAPAPIAVLVGSSTGAVLPFTASATSSPDGWISLAGASGVTPGTMTITINPAFLAPGVFWGTVLLASPTQAFAPVSITVMVSVTVGPSGYRPLECLASSAVPPQIRMEGLAERLGDIVLTCTGGTAGTVVHTTVDLQLTDPHGPAFTSRVVNPPAGTEAMLMDEASTPPFQDSNPIQGVLVSPHLLRFPNVSIVAPGNGPFPSFVNGVAKRIVNVRIDASPLGSTARDIVLAPVLLTTSGITVFTDNRVFPAPVVVCAFAQPGLSFSLATAADTPVSGISFQQAAGENTALVASPNATSGVVDFHLTFAETFGTAFLTRTSGLSLSLTDPNKPLPQNLGGVIYNSESGFYDPTFSSSDGLNVAGLATQGTRLMARFTNIPPGVALYATVKPVSVLSSGGILPPTVASTAQLIATDASGAGAYSPVAATTTATNPGGPDVGIAPIPVSGGTATAVWEVVATNPAAMEQFTFGVVAAYQSPQVNLGMATVNGSYAPLSTVTTADSTSPVPRFTQLAPLNPPSLSIAKTHTGNFIRGQTGVTYTITVSNALSGGPTSDMVSVFEQVPAGMTLVSMSGAGWDCSEGIFCNRSDVLKPGMAYPAITAILNVANNAPDTIINTAILFGGYSNAPSHQADDPAGILQQPFPDLTITNTHSGNFTQGQAGAAYTITVGNIGQGPTNGTVTARDTVPAGLTAIAMSGPGWTCTPPSGPCTRSDVLSAGGSYPSITLTVNVTNNAPASVTNTAFVSGGDEINTSNDTAGDSTTIMPSQPDLALGKSATQSSTLPGYAGAAAASAVDGNTDGAFFDGSVTATNADPNAWWQVDLGASATVSSVVVWNRTDCCGSRLNDYWVFVSNSPFGLSDTPATLQNRAATFSSHQTAAPNPSTTIAAGGAQGRYVRVQLTGANYLSLAEVQVFGAGGAPPPTNLAQNKLATQSSTLPGYPTAGANAAVDGNTDGAFFDGSVSATNLDPNPWWQVDLGASAAVSSIAVWNRTDCCGSRLNDFWVFVSDTPFSPTDTPATLQNRAGTFASHQTAAPNPSTVIAAGGTQGRYVRVQLTGANYLSLAEVQVFGTGAPAFSSLAQGKTATQSSTLPGYATAGAAGAVDGNQDGNFFDGSVTATNLDTNAWWQVDLGASATVSSIVVWNRTDCCGSRLNDYWVFVSDTPFGATDTPATLHGRAATFSSHQTAAPNPSATIAAGAQGRYVRVQLTGANYLSLAEVQVFGQ